MVKLVETTRVFGNEGEGIDYVIGNLKDGDLINEENGKIILSMSNGNISYCDKNAFIDYLKSEYDRGFDEGERIGEENGYENGYDEGYADGVAECDEEDD